MIFQGAHSLAQSKTPTLDCELLLAFALGKPRSYLYAWPDHAVDAKSQEIFQQLLNRRKQGEPIAYILGEKEFWSLTFKVTPDTLIPRPETECLVEQVLEHLSQEVPIQVADIGTGSGAIAISLAKERPHWQIHATDISAKALAIARSNAENLGIKNIQFHLGSFCEPLPHGHFSALISNPPYVADDDEDLEASCRDYEPKNALISPENGLQHIRILCEQAPNYLNNNGLLVLEHGSYQARQVAELMQQWGFKDIESYLDCAGLARVCLSHKPG